VRFLEPIVRPRPLLWATAVLGLLLALPVSADPAMSPFSRVMTPFVLPAGLVFVGMFVHAMCLIFLRSGTAGSLGCPELLPPEVEVRYWTDRTEWSCRSVQSGLNPMGALVTVAWIAPEPISWRDQLALTRITWWRPLPALLVAPVLIGCLFFLAACDRLLGTSVPSDRPSR